MRMVVCVCDCLFVCGWLCVDVFFCCVFGVGVCVCLCVCFLSMCVRCVFGWFVGLCLCVSGCLFACLLVVWPCACLLVYWLVVGWLCV